MQCRAGRITGTSRGCRGPILERRWLKDMSAEKDKITFWRRFTIKIYDRDKTERETAKQKAKLRLEEKRKRQLYQTV